jgi:predicted nucleic acid-binding protein
MSEYLDTSIIVKWFREAEDHHDEAMEILERIKSMESSYMTSSLTILELTRALIKAGESEDRIRYASDMLEEYFEIGALEKVRVDSVINMALELEIDLMLNSYDAVHVASAIINRCETFWSEDKHHTKVKTKEYLKKFDIEVRSLKDL